MAARMSGRPDGKAEAIALLDRLHHAHNQFYGGEDSAPLAELLTAESFGPFRVTI